MTTTAESNGAAAEALSSREWDSTPQQPDQDALVQAVSFTSIHSKPAIGSPEGWPALHSDHPLLIFHSRLESIIESAGHSIIYGVKLNPHASEFGTFLVMQKFLRSVAGGGDVDAAAAALEKALKWRREFGLDQGKAEEDFGSDFDGLGYVTHQRQEEGTTEVLTWNLYGAVEDLGKTFGDLDRFLRWRVALMERAMSHLNLATTTVPIPDFGKGPDPHRMIQLHIYTGVSFLRLDPRVKAASKAVIQLMVANYPETLARKLFIGVPVFMSWMFAAVRVFISAETARKFSIVGDEEGTAAELGGEKDDVPKKYGGTSALALPELDQKAESEFQELKVPKADA